MIFAQLRWGRWPMGASMANSKEVMTRLAKLETNVAAMTKDVADLKAAAWRTTEILVDHTEALSGLQRSMEGMQRSMEGMQRSVEGMQRSVEGVQRSVDERLGGVTDRLDRLIAVTIQERTASAERLGDIERRIARLEERVGI
jgi:chromosome segregation ATPase